MSTRLKNARFLLLMLAVAGGLGVAAPQSAQTLPKALDDEIAATIKEWQIPGAANPFSQGRPAFASFELDETGKVTGLRMELMRDRIEARRK